MNKKLDKIINLLENISNKMDQDKDYCKKEKNTTDMIHCLDKQIEFYETIREKLMQQIDGIPFFDSSSFS